MDSKIRWIIDECAKESALRFDCSRIDFIKADKGLEIIKENSLTKVYYSRLCDIARAVLILNAHHDDKRFHVKEASSFKEIGFMLDCARNGVATLETLRRLIRVLAMLGYNQFMLYLEDVFEVEGEPMFGYLRGRYTREELQAIDAYAAGFGIEVIPFIQTLAHLNELKKWKQYSSLFDCADILLCGDERVYNLIRKELKMLSECFSSKKIHIGMDEAFLLGRGRYLDLNGYRDATQIFVEHLDRVVSIAKEFGYSPMIWGDMFNSFIGRDFDEGTGGADKIHKDVELVYWDYYSTEKEHYDEQIKQYLRFGNPLRFAGGVWRFTGFTPNNTYSMMAMDASLAALKENGIDKIMTTAWGDNGSETSVFAALPATAYFSLSALELPFYETKRQFFALTGIGFDDFIKLDSIYLAFADPNEKKPNTVSKNSFYNDLFLGYLDKLYEQKRDVDFAGISQEISGIGAGTAYQYLFKMQAALASVLEIKYDLGIRIRKSYKERDFEEIGKIISDIDVLLNRIGVFYESFEDSWYRENKPFGFEVQDIRIGGVLHRIKHCRRILEKFLRREITRIEELEIDLYDKTFDGLQIKDFAINNWALCTTNVLF